MVYFGGVYRVRRAPDEARSAISWESATAARAAALLGREPEVLAEAFLTEVGP